MDVGGRKWDGRWGVVDDYNDGTIKNVFSARIRLMTIDVVQSEERAFDIRWSLFRNQPQDSGLGMVNELAGNEQVD